MVESFVIASVSVLNIQHERMAHQKKNPPTRLLGVVPDYHYQQHMVESFVVTSLATAI